MQQAAMGMPIVFNCTKGHALSVDPSLAGKRVRCPLCQEVLTAPTPVPAAAPLAPATVEILPLSPPPDPPRLEIAEKPPSMPVALAAPAPAPMPPVADAVSAPAVVKVAAGDGAAYAVSDAEAAPPRRDYMDFLVNLLQRKTKRQQLETVRLGLGFHYWKYLVTIISVLLLQSGVLMLTVDAFPIWIGGLALVLGYLGYFAAPGLGLAGSVLCIQAPEKTNGRPLILISMILDLIGLLLAAVSACVALLSANSAIAILLTTTFTFSSFVLFMLFLRALALFFDDQGSADEAVSIIVFLVSTTLGGFACTAFGAALFYHLVGGSSAVIFAAFVIVICVGLYFQMLFRILALISTVRARM